MTVDEGTGNRGFYSKADKKRKKRTIATKQHGPKPPTQPQTYHRVEEKRKKN